MRLEAQGYDVGSGCAASGLGSVHARLVKRVLHFQRLLEAQRKRPASVHVQTLGPETWEIRESCRRDICQAVPQIGCDHKYAPR